MSNLEQTPIKKEGRISSSNWNLILFMIGFLYSAAMPIGAITILTGIISKPWYRNALNPIFQALGNFGLIMVFLPTAVLTIILLKRKARYSALALVGLTALNYTIGIIFSLLLIAMLNE